MGVLTSCHQGISIWRHLHTRFLENRHGGGKDKGGDTHIKRIYDQEITKDVVSSKWQAARRWAERGHEGPRRSGITCVVSS